MKYTFLLLFLFVGSMAQGQIDSSGIESEDPTIGEPQGKRIRSFKIIGLSNGIYKIRKANDDFTDDIKVDVKKDVLNQFIDQYRVALINKKNTVNATRNQIDQEVRKYDREIKAIGNELKKVPEMEDVGGSTAPATGPDLETFMANAKLLERFNRTELRNMATLYSITNAKNLSKADAVTELLKVLK